MSSRNWTHFLLQKVKIFAAENEQVEIILVGIPCNTSQILLPNNLEQPSLAQNPAFGKISL